MASYTEHLELLKKDPVADGADTFNIQTMLNDNWEKIDAAVAGKADVGEDGKIPASQLPEMNYDPAGSAAAVQANLAAHMADKNNPHGLDANDVGARPNTWVPAWGDVTGKPSTFPPSGHTHDASQIVSGILPAARGGTGVGSIAALASLLAGQGAGMLTKLAEVSLSASASEINIAFGSFGIDNYAEFLLIPDLIGMSTGYLSFQGVASGYRGTVISGSRSYLTEIYGANSGFYTTVTIIPQSDRIVAIGTPSSDDGGGYISTSDLPTLSSLVLKIAPNGGTISAGSNVTLYGVKK